MSEIDEVMVEKAARAIEPEVWARFDNATRPYIENRGASCDGEQHWYALTWAAGCRSVEDVKNWWTICDDAVATWDVHVWRQSWNKARAALTAIFPDLREQHYAECAAGIPKHIVEQVLSMGRVEWGATAEQTSTEHVASFENTLRLTREYFNLDDAPVQMHGLYLEGTETVLCHTGTSPNSSKNAQALTGAWNYLFDMCKAIERDDHLTKEGKPHGAS